MMKVIYQEGYNEAETLEIIKVHPEWARVGGEMLSYMILEDHEGKTVEATYLDFTGETVTAGLPENW